MFANLDFEEDQRRIVQAHQLSGYMTGKLLDSLYDAFQLDNVKDEKRRRMIEQQVKIMMQRMAPFLAEILELVEAQKDEIKELEDEVDRFLYTNMKMIDTLRSNGLLKDEHTKEPPRETLRKMRAARTK